MVQDRQLVGESLRLLQFVGHQHGRDPAVRDQGPDQVGEAAAEAGVESRVRLVQEQSVAPGQQQAAERDPVLLAAGQPGRHRVEQALDAQPGGQRADLRAVAVGTRAVGQVGPHRQVREQARILAEQPDPAAPGRYVGARRRGRGEYPAAQRDLRAPRPDQAGDGLQDRGLARAGRAEQGEPLPRRDGQLGAHQEVAAVNLDGGAEHERSRRRRQAARAARPPAARRRTARPSPARFPGA